MVKLGTFHWQDFAPTPLWLRLLAHFVHFSAAVRAALRSLRPSPTKRLSSVHAASTRGQVAEYIVMGLGPGSRGQKCSRFFVPQGTENVNWGQGGAQLERPRSSALCRAGSQPCSRGHSCWPCSSVVEQGLSEGQGQRLGAWQSSSSIARTALQAACCWLGWACLGMWKRRADEGETCFCLLGLALCGG